MGTDASATSVSQPVVGIDYADRVEFQGSERGTAVHF